ncbi:Carboxylate/amino acid/amine transporter family protein [Spironucleus salmonicida]|uniref:Carboxylate/amino acid/amine transporter family protein n=1 Tax=Spironucleus salmonicida TaxID=348837 RepID=V6LKB0_9EUKA|nr:Carboxylate/amino acid/amine transporter family protein [Spironucleus salmonicida]|eukprot:EST45070.1 Carboxylate/amino acid/amine transporter family protein [Spironucleus salmonicida]
MQHILGQSIALLNALIGATLQSTQYFYGQSLPFTAATLFFVLSLLLFAFKSSRQKRSKRQQILFLSCGILDFSANCFLNLGFKFSNVASVLLLLSLSTPFAMVFTRILIGQKYDWQRILLAVLSVGFGIIYVLLDTETAGAKNIILGDIFAFVGCILYALGSVINQMGCEGVDSVCFLANMAPGAVIVGSVISGVSEYNLFQTIKWQTWLLILAYAVEMMIFYYITVLLLQKTAAVYFNLCLLVSNVYSFVIAIFLFKTTPKWYIIFPIIGLLACTILYFWYDDKVNKKFLKDNEILQQHSYQSLNIDVQEQVNEN